MNLLQDIRTYLPANEQEARDQQQMLRYLTSHPDCLSRKDSTAHVTVSIWTVNKARTKTLMVYHKLYDSWSWIGGHADGDADLPAVAMRELQEETGITNATLVSRDIFSLELLPVSGHFKNGVYVSSHLHLNITYLAVADEREALTANDEENTGVKWFSFEDALAASTEPWMVEHIYKKLIKKSKE